jgi:hypothetical protein
MEAARQYRAKALSIDSAADTKITDAWLRANSGDVDRALARLREIDTADARSNLFIMLSLHHGRQRALEWLDANGPIDAKFLTALGWKNAATLLAEAGRFATTRIYDHRKTRPEDSPTFNRGASKTADHVVRSAEIPRQQDGSLLTRRRREPDSNVRFRAR